MRQHIIKLFLAFSVFCFSSASMAQELIVSAAASLSNVFTELGAEFEKNNPGVKVTFNFAASGVLLRQIEQGAPVDVFASADQLTMDKAAKADLIDLQTRVNFAENKLVLIVPSGMKKPKKIKDLKEKTYGTLAIGTPSSVPAGNYTQQVLIKEGLWETLEAKFVYGESVRQVLQYVKTKEADAGFVYATDAAVSSKEVDVAVIVPTSERITYPIAQVKKSEHKELGKKFVEFILSEKSKNKLQQYGFSDPTP